MPSFGSTDLRQEQRLAAKAQLEEPCPALPVPLRTSPPQFAPCRAVFSSLLASVREFVWLSWRPSRGFSITRCPCKSLLFSPRDEQSSQSISKTVLAVEVRGRSSTTASVPHGGCAQVGGSAGFHMKEPHCNAASFKSAQLEVPQGLGAVTQGKRPHLAPVPGTRCIWRGRNGLEMLVWSCWRGIA